MLAVKDGSQVLCM